MRTLLHFSGIFLLIFLIACGHSDTANQEPVLTASSDEIVAMFLEDEASATTKLVDQVIEVNGPIMELVKENGKVIGIKLSSDEFNIVNASLQYPLDSDQMNGQEEMLTLKGICSGFLGDSDSMLPGGTVEIKRAAIVTSTTN